MNEIVNIADLLNIAVVGAILSVLIELIGQFFATRPAVTKLMTIGLCLLVSGAYVWLKSTPYFTTVMVVLMSASTVYAFVFNKK